MANNLLTARVTIKGSRPLLWHRFGPDSIPLEKQEKTGKAGNDPEEWRKTVMYDKQTRQLYIEPTYIFATIRDGSRNTKKGRGSIQPAVVSTLQVIDTRIYVDRFMPADGDPPIDDQDAPIYIHVSSVRNPATKARNVRYRVCASPGWSASFSVMWDSTIVSRGEIHAAIIDAGKLCGLGDGRSVGFGRFEVESIEIE